MTMGELACSRRDDAEHGPQRVCDGQGLVEVLVGEQYAYAATFSGERVILRFLELLHDGCPGIERWLKSVLGFFDAEISKKGRVVHRVEACLGRGMVGSCQARKREDVALVPF